MPIPITSNSNDDEWLAWVAVQKRVLRLKIAGRLKEAIGEITAFLTLGQPSDIQCDALAFRAMIEEEEEGEIGLAREDRHKARALAPSGSYAKYTIELGMAGLYEKTGEIEDAVSWYIEALKTVVNDPTTSGEALWQTSWLCEISQP